MAERRLARALRELTRSTPPSDVIAADGRRYPPVELAADPAVVTPTAEVVLRRSVGSRLSRALTLPGLETHDSSALAATAKATKSPWNGSGVNGATLPTPEHARGSDVTDFLEAMADRTWVYACVTRKAKSMKKGKLVVEPDTDDPNSKPLAKHGILDLFKNPSPNVSPGLFQEQMQMDLDLAGNFYAEVVYGTGNTGVPLQMFRMRPDKVRIAVDTKTGEVNAYYFVPGGPDSAVRFEPWQVWHRRYANPLDEYRGLSPLAAARDSIAFEYQAKAQGIAFFANGLRMSGVISGPEDTDPDDLALMRRILEGRHGGAPNAHRILLLPGQWNYTDLSKTPKDADWIEGLQMSRREVCAIYRVSPPLAGDFSEGTTFSNMEEARDSFWQDTMTEHYDARDEDINHSLLPRFGAASLRLRVRSDLSGIAAFQDDVDKSTARAVAAFAAGIVTLNEARDITTVEALEPLDHGDVRRLPIAVEEVSIEDDSATDPNAPPPAPLAPPPSDGNPPKPAPTGDAKPDPEPDDPQAGKQAAPALSVRTGAVRTAAAFPEARKARTWPIVKKSAKAMRKTFAQQHDDLIRWIESGGSHEAVPASSGEPQPEEIAGLVRTFNWDGAQAAITKTARQTHLLAAEAAWEHSRDIGLGVSFKIDDPSVVQRLKALADRPTGIKLIAGQQKADVIDEIKRSLQAGASWQQIKNGGDVKQVDGSIVKVDGIRGIYAPWSAPSQAWKAERVARTETGVAYNTSSLDSYRSEGIDKVTVYDGDYDEDCAGADGQVWSVDKADSEPLQHPNCVRAFGPYTGDDD